VLENSTYDLAWRATIPVAELLAIEFSQDLSPNNYFYHGWRLDSYYKLMAKGTEVRSKLDHLKRSVQDYPEEFGGYHIKYGSFSAAMEEAWLAHGAIADRELRFPILELALHILYLDENNQIRVNDPLEVIIRTSSHALHQGSNELQDQLARLTAGYGHRGRLLTDRLTRELLSGIPDTVSSHRNMALALSYLMLEQKSGKLNEISPPMINKWVDTLSRSFMRVELGENDQASIALNPNFVITAHHRISHVLNHRNGTPTSKLQGELSKSILEQPRFMSLWQDLGLHPDWWRRLALLEALRFSLKSGTPLICPFKGWRFEDFGIGALEDYPIKCDDQCIIGSWLRRLKAKTEIVAGHATCEE